MEGTFSGSSVYRRALEITWLAVIFLIPVVFNPQSGSVFLLTKVSVLQFLVFTMLAFWVADWFLNRPSSHGSTGQGIWRSPLHLSVLIFGLVAVTATAVSITPAISFWGTWYRKAGLLTLICWILFFLIAAQQIRTRSQLLRAVYTLLVSSGIVSIIGIMQHFFPDTMLKVFQTQIQIGDRIASTIGNPLFLSSFLAMVIPLNMALIVYLWNNKKEGNNAKILIGLVILLALQFWCLWLAQYSITILLYIIAPIVFIILLGIAKRKRLLLGLGAISFIALALIAALLVIPLLFSAHSSETTTVQDVETAPLSEEVGLKTLDWRVQYWKGAVDIILKSPEVPFSNDKLHNWRKIIGYGPETFTFTFQLFYPDKLKSMDTHASTFIDRPHNDYLYLATTKGLLGLMSFLSILAIFFYLCFRYFRRTKADIYKLLLIAMAAGMLQYMADIFFNLSTISPELVFWLTLSMVCVIGRFSSNKESVRPELVEVVQTEGSGTHYFPRSRFFVSLGCAVALIIAGTLISIRPVLADIYFKKAMKLQNTPNQEAIIALDKATRIYPEEDIYWHSLGAYSYYLARHVNGETPRTALMNLANIAYENARELDPYFFYRYLFQADAYTYWAENGPSAKWAPALSLYNQASQLFPDNAVILDKWALALIIKGDLNEARVKLDNAATIDPEWVGTSFLSGLLLAKEGKDQEAAAMITGPIHNDPFNLNYYIDLCIPLMRYNMLGLLDSSLETYTQEVPSDWAAHALLGTTSLFSDNLDMGLDEFKTAMLLVPDNDIADLFRAIRRLTNMSQKFKAGIPSIATDWRDKLAQSPERDTLLPAFDQLIGSSSPK